MNFDKRIVIKIAIIALTVIVGLVITPLQAKQYFDLNKKIKKCRDDISKIQDEVNTKPQITASITEIKTEIDQINAGIISYQDVSSLQAYISAAAKENKVELVETGSAPPVLYKKIGPNQYISIPINLSLRAGYHNLGRFISAIEQGDYPLRIQELQITGTQPVAKQPYTGGNHTISLNIIALAKE